jgi:hypothetical protein
MTLGRQLLTVERWMGVVCLIRALLLKSEVRITQSSWKAVRLEIWFATKFLGSLATKCENFFMGVVFQSVHASVIINGPENAKRIFMRFGIGYCR